MMEPTSVEFNFRVRKEDNHVRYRIVLNALLNGDALWAREVEMASFVVEQRGLDSFRNEAWFLLGDGDKTYGELREMLIAAAITKLLSVALVGDRDGRLKVVPGNVGHRVDLGDIDVAEKESK